MELKNYLELAKRTMPDYGKDMNLYHSSTGVATEFGELIDNLKRHLFYKKEIDIPNLKEELGDACWYFAILLNEFNIEPKILKGANVFNGYYFYNINKMYSREFQLTSLIKQSINFIDTYNNLIDDMVNRNYYSSVITKNQNQNIYSDKTEDLFSLILALCQYFEIDFNEVLELNIKKLEARYKQKNGGIGFTTESAINRDVDSERVILEGK